MEFLKKLLFWWNRGSGSGRLVGSSFFISLVFHLTLLGGATVLVISHVFYNRESTFTAQPVPMKSYDPRQLEFKVKVSKQQRSSSRPSMAPRMVAMKASTLSLPEIKMDAKIVNTSFQPKFKAVGGTGLGVGLGTGYGVGGFGTGVSQFDFFGIRGRGDRIVVLLDVSVSMVEDERGGPAGYARVKSRINEVIDQLNEVAMFNVVAFADAANTWQEKMVIASAENKKKAKEFVEPYNEGGGYGLTSGNVSGISGPVPALGGTTRLDLALDAAFEDGADTILIISDGLPKVEKGVAQGQRVAYEKQLTDFRKEHAKEIATAQEADVKAEANAHWEDQKVWIPDQPAVPIREGQPARPAVKGHWETRHVQVGGRPAGGPAAPPAPPPPQVQYWNLEDFVRHLAALQAKFYEPKGRKAPVIHTIGYQIDDEGGKFLRSLTNKYQGRYRRVAKVE